MNNKKLTIITINYNNKEGLLKTFESIKNQTWLDFEYIVIDGGSTDGGKELIENNKQINYWVSEKDSGVYNAMNKGIRAATGDYIIFMNSGDFFYDENVLEKVEKNFDTDISILYGNTVFFNDDNYRREEKPPKKLSFVFFYYKGINHQAAFIKRSLFSTYFLYNESYKICSDWEFFIRVICSKNESYLHLGEYICYYDFSGISADPKNLHIYHQERKTTLNKYFPLMLEDFAILSQLKSKRLRQILYIKNNVVAWRILKWIVSIFIIIMPKDKTSKSKIDY
jgi:glycosyltransferase involved in cell wall biosynthesis